MSTEKITRELRLLNKYGMHVRPAGLFAKCASRFDADVEVEKDGNVVSGKSIMALMTLEAVCGTVLRVTASGPQASEALDELEALVQRKFDIPDEQCKYPSTKMLFAKISCALLSILWIIMDDSISSLIFSAQRVPL